MEKEDFKIWLRKKYNMGYKSACDDVRYCRLHEMASMPGNDSRKRYAKKDWLI